MTLPLVLALSLIAPAQTSAARLTARGSSPVVSPDGRLIAFVADRQIFVVGADGTGRRQLSHAAVPAAGEQWSRDGRRIRFQTFVNNASHVYEVDVDGTNEHELFTVPGRGPQLSPDDRHVVFGGGTSWTATEFTVADTDLAAIRSSRMINDGTSVAWNAKWSPDGSAIAFTGRDANDVLQIYVVKADGSDRRQLTHNAAADGNAQLPAWSADGAWLAYQVNMPDHRGCIWVVRANGTGARVVEQHTAVYLDETPSWFPDGKRLAFQSDRSGAMDVWTVAVDGSRLAQLTKSSDVK